MPIGWKQEIVTYTGNDANDRTIPTSFALDTGAVVVWLFPTAGSNIIYVRTSAMPAGQSQQNGDATLNTNQINSFSASGFVVDVSANSNTVPYLAVVMRDTTGSYLKVGAYSGDGLAGHSVDVDGGSTWAPEVVWTFNRRHIYRLSGFPSNAAQAGWAQRSDNNPGEAGPTSITSLTSTGFVVGTGVDANGSGDTVHYAVLKDLTAPDFVHFTEDGVTAPYELASLGFGGVPGFVFGKRHGSGAGTSAGLWRGATTHTGTNSQFYAGAVDTIDGITAINTDAATFGATISLAGAKFSGWAWPSASSPDTLQFFTYGAISL